jgi:hypothetical protein
MRRLAANALALSVVVALSAAAAEQSPGKLSNEQIAEILANISKRPQLKPTPLCGLASSPASCRLFALPDASTIATSPLLKTQDPLRVKPFGQGFPAAQVAPPKPVTVACPKDDHFHTCKVVDSLTDLGPGQIGATLYLGGSRSAELSQRASSGLLTSTEVRGLLSEKTIGLLPQAVETSAADRAVGILARSGIAKAGRGAAVVGVALMTYAAYEYFFGTDAKPDDKGEPKK